MRDGVLGLKRLVQVHARQRGAHHVVDIGADLLVAKFGGLGLGVREWDGWSEISEGGGFHRFDSIRFDSIE